MTQSLLLAALSAMVWAQAPTPVTPDPHETPAVQSGPTPKDTKVAPKSAPKAASPKKAPAKSAAKAPVKPIDPPQPQEVMLGVWKLVPDLSKFEPGPPPREETRTYKQTPEGVVALIETTDQKGMVHAISYPWTLDNSEHHMTGSELLDTIRLRQIDNLTAEASLSHGTKVLATERRSISADGKTMTIVMTDMTSEERPITVKAVYEKQ